MKKLLLASALCLGLIGCNGGNGNGAPGYSHNELAEVFVQNLNLDADFDVTLVKKSTLESNFVVIYDPLYDSYDAINIDNYNPSTNDAADYYNANSGRFFYDLDVIPGHYQADYRYGIIGYDYDGYAIYGYYWTDVWVPTRYRDRSSGLVFEKIAATPKDLAKVAAIAEVAQVEKSAKFLSSEFGLSLERGKELARLTAHWKKASKKGMTASEQDAFATEALGFSITQGIEAVQSNDASSLNTLVEQAAEANGITPEHATQLMTKVFGL
ncbi:MAG: hypothetical protein CME62_14195 [Halobacteriovoraceae bacterium]|nr:hypothetical protein [Halobacteriovoraceae bacterium]|tara:strand:- start:12752 stop:13558 length:807 start_codon:yes stop_codon:yes gene_type:complete